MLLISFVSGKYQFHCQTGEFQHRRAGTVPRTCASVASIEQGRLFQSGRDKASIKLRVWFSFQYFNMST
jgi:hypothetical protein